METDALGVNRSISRSTSSYWISWVPQGVTALNLARPPWARSRCEAKAELSLSREKAERAKERRGEAKRGVVRETWYADLVLVPKDAVPSKVSAPPKMFRILAVTFYPAVSMEFNVKLL